MKPTFGTHASIWLNTFFAAFGAVFNDTAVLQALGSKAGYAMAAVSVVNAIAHAVTGNAPVVK